MVTCIFFPYVIAGGTSHFQLTGAGPEIRGIKIKIYCMIDNKVNLRLESINVLYYIIHNINKKNHQYKYKDN